MNRVKENLKKFLTSAKTLLVSAGLIVSSFAGISAYSYVKGDSVDGIDSGVNSQPNNALVKDEVDTNRRRLDTLANATADGDVDYTNMGC